MTKKPNEYKGEVINTVSPKSKKGRRVVVAARDMPAAIADLLKGEGALTLAARYGTTLRNINELRATVEATRDALIWIRENEAEILDILRTDILAGFAVDPERRWSTVDYGILMDKARLLRSQVHSLGGLVAVIHEVDRSEKKRLSGEKD